MLRLAHPVDARAGDDDRAVVARADAHAELRERRGSAADVGTVGEMLDPAATVGDRAHEQRAVGDPLAAGQPQATAQRPTALDHELVRQGHGSALHDGW